MRLVVSAMAWLRSAWPWLWRLGVLALPWQTRWFQEGVLVGGYPWEQGRISVYISWLILGAVVLCAWILPRASLRAAVSYTRPQRCLIGSGAVLFLCSLIFSQFLPATFMWLIQGGLLTLFFVALRRQALPVESIMAWVAFSLLPHAMLGSVQFVMQEVLASTWLGIAAQQPATPGVSVIVSEGVRILRVYGGFPHPNIFGGWLAIVLLWIGIFVARSQAKGKVLTWTLLGMWYAVVLFLTFSRSAWLAGVVGCLYAVMVLYRRKEGSVKRAGSFFILCALAVSLIAVTQSSLVVERVRPTARLEQRSLNEREQSLRQGWELFLRHPWLGTGPGTTIYALEREGVWSPSQSIKGPPAPPHFLPLLILIELGLVGSLGVGLLISTMGIQFHQRQRRHPLTAMPLISLGVIGLFDHYPWSLWSGQALLVLAVVLCFTSSVDENVNID